MASQTAQSVIEASSEGKPTSLVSAMVWSVATRPDLYIVALPDRDVLVRLLDPVDGVLSTFTGVHRDVKVSSEGNIVAIPVGRNLAWLECKRLRY